MKGETVYILWKGDTGVEVIDTADEHNSPEFLVAEYTAAFSAPVWSRTWSKANKVERKAIDEWEN